MSNIRLTLTPVGDKLLCTKMKRKTAKSSQPPDNPDVSVLFQAVSAALFEIAPDGWNPISVSDWTYPMAPEGKTTQAYVHRDEVADVMLYRVPDEDCFKIDLYQRLQFNNVRNVFKKKYRTKTAKKLALEKAFEEDLNVAEKLFPGCVVFFSRDLMDDLKGIKGMKPHPDRPDEEINYDVIAAAPIYLYKRHTLLTISKTMMDEDYTPKDMYVLVPRFSFVAHRMGDDGKPNKVYELIREIYAEAIIVNAEGWAESAIENGMCGASMKKENGREEGIEDWMEEEEAKQTEVKGIAMDTTPVKIGDSMHWGEQENGDVLFTKEQMEEIDFDFKSVLRLTPAKKWGILIPNKNNFPELLGLDYSIGYQSGNTTYAISMMKDYDGSRFYVFTTFVNGKKTGGNVFYEKDFANYTLCKYRMNIVMQMMITTARVLEEAAKALSSDEPKKRTSSRNAKAVRRRKS